MSACWLNEDCIRGHHTDGECRFPSWTSTCEHCGSLVLDPDSYRPGVDRYSDTPGGHADRHTLVVEAAERVIQPCGPCRFGDHPDCAGGICPCCTT